MLRRAQVPLWGPSCPQQRGDGHGWGWPSWGRLRQFLLLIPDLCPQAEVKVLPPILGKKVAFHFWSGFWAPPWSVALRRMRHSGRAAKIYPPI